MKATDIGESECQRKYRMNVKTHSNLRRISVWHKTNIENSPKALSLQFGNDCNESWWCIIESFSDPLSNPDSWVTLSKNRQEVWMGVCESTVLTNQANRSDWKCFSLCFESYDRSLSASIVYTFIYLITYLGGGPALGQAQLKMILHSSEEVLETLSGAIQEALK